MAFSVLMYHGIHNAPDAPGYYDPIYSISNESFCTQLDWLCVNGYTSVPLVIAMDKQRCYPKKSVVITFDDGDISNYTKAFPELKKRGMVAEFYVTSDWIGNKYSMDDGHLADVVHSGMIVQSHGASHRFLDSIPLDEIESEITTSCERIFKATGQKVTSLALPGGRGNKDVHSVAERCGIKYICRSEIGLNQCAANPYFIRRVPITSGFTLDIFSSLVSCTGSPYKKTLLKQISLAYARRLLGNKLYCRIREQII